MRLILLNVQVFAVLSAEDRADIERVVKRATGTDRVVVAPRLVRFEGPLPRTVEEVERHCDRLRQEWLRAMN